MSDEPQHKTSRLGLIVVFIAVGGSAIGVAGWHLFSNRAAGLDTSGFDMSAAPEASSPAFPASVPAAPAAASPNSLGMVKGGEGVTIVGAGTASTSKPAKPAASGASPGTADPREAAALSFKEAARKNEKFVYAFVRRMERKHPSITRYGKDWAASPELRALRDQYWKEKDPLKFAYGLARSKDFAKLIRKYGSDPGIRDVLVTGIREAPPSLTGAVGGLFQNDNVSKSLVSTVIKAVGLPPSLTSFLDGGSKPPDQNQVMSEIMNSDDMKKAMKNQAAPAVALPDQSPPPEQTGGFQPLGTRR